MSFSLCFVSFDDFYLLERKRIPVAILKRVSKKSSIRGKLSATELLTNLLFWKNKRISRRFQEEGLLIYGRSITIF